MPREAINAMVLACSLGVCTVYVYVYATVGVHVRGRIVIRIWIRMYGAVHGRVGWDEDWVE
jgi:hypothetical protein